MVPTAKAAGEEIAKAISTVYGLVRSGHLSDELVVEMSIGVDRGVLYLIGEFKKAFDGIAAYAKSTLSSMWQGFLNEMVTPEERAMFSGGTKPKPAAKSAAPDPVSIPGIPDEGPGEVSVEDEVAAHLDAQLAKRTAILALARQTANADKPDYSKQTARPPGDGSEGDGGVAKRTKEVNEGKTAEREYKDALEATKGLLESGQLSEEQATNRDIQTTQNYIARLQQLQATMSPTSEQYQRMTRDIDMAQASLLKLSEGQSIYQNALTLTKSRVDAGIISQSQAEAEDNKTITAYIGRLQAARAATQQGSAAYQDLTTKLNQANTALQKTTTTGSMVSGLRSLANEWTDLSKKATEAAKSIATAISSSVGTALEDAIFKTGNWKEAFLEAGEAIVKTLIEMVVQYTLGRALMSAINAIFGNADESAVEGQASTAATAWAPAAVSASTASYGVAAGAGLAAYVAAMGAGVTAAASMTGFLAGGFTGGREGQVAGLVHGEEFVFNADATRHWGVQTLHALSQMRIPVSVPRTASLGSGSAAGGSAPGYSPTRRASGPRSGRGGSNQPIIHLHNHPDVNTMQKFMASNPGRHIILNHVKGNAVDLGI